MAGETVSLHDLLDTTNRVVIPQDWWERPAEYGLYRPYYVENPMAVIAEIRMGKLDDADQATLHVPCVLGVGKYGAIAISEGDDGESLALYPWAKREVCYGNELVGKLENALVRAGINPVQYRGQFPDWYIEANSKWHRDLQRVDQCAVSRIPTLLHALSRHGGVSRVTEVKFITRAQHPAFVYG